MSFARRAAKEPSWAHGSVAGRSTEGAILTMLSAAWRLKETKTDNVAMLFDASNAFSSVALPHLADVMAELAPDEDKEQHNEQLAQQCFDLVTEEGTTTFRPKVGIMMGKSGGPATFIRSYNKKLQTWNNTTSHAHPAQMGLRTRDPVTNRMTDLSLTTFVDDIAKTIIEEEGGMTAVAGEVEDRLGDKMEEIGLKMNADKTEHLPAAFGPGSAQRPRRVCFAGPYQDHGAKKGGGVEFEFMS